MNIFREFQYNLKQLEIPSKILKNEQNDLDLFSVFVFGLNRIRN